MTRPSQLTKALVEAGLDRRPMRSRSELIAEHREMEAALREADDILEDLAGCAEPDDLSEDAELQATRRRIRAILKRCEAPTADRSAA